MTSDKLRLEPPPTTLPPGSTVWAYLRDSGGPTQDRSVEQQREMIFEYCAQHGLILAHPPFEDVHKTGTTVKNRNDFDYMISLSATKELRPNGLLIWNFARFSRGGEYQSQFYKGTIRTRGIIIHSLTDKIPEGEFAPVVESVIELTNKFKAEEASAGAWRGLRFNLKQGAVPGIPAVGIKRNPIVVVNEKGEERNAHRWDPDPAFKTRVRKAFLMRAQEKPLKLIHKETQLFRSQNSYLTFYKNAIYKGELHYGDQVIKNYCEAIVPVKIWDRVQVVIGELAQKQKVRTSRRHPRRQSGVYILSGISKCGLCDSPHYGMTSYQRNGTAYLRYACTRAQRRKDCKAKPIPAKFLEETVLGKIVKFFEAPENLINVITAFQENNSSFQSHVDEELASLSAQLASVRKAITNFTNAISEAGHSQALLKRLSAAEAQEKEVLTKIQQLKTQVIPPIIVPTIEQARAAAQKIKADLQSKDRTFIRQILLGIIHEVVATREKNNIHIKIVFYHTVEDKKKAASKTASLSLPPVGAPTYRHSISFEGTIPNNGRPRNKPVM